MRQSAVVREKRMAAKRLAREERKRREDRWNKIFIAVCLLLVIGAFGYFTRSAILDVLDQLANHPSPTETATTQPITAALK